MVALAEEPADDEESVSPPPPPPIKRTAPAKPRVASKRRPTTEDQESPYENIRASGEAKSSAATDIAFQGGVFAGYSGMNGSEAVASGTNVPSYMHQTVGFGALVDLRAAKYFGAEGDGYLGLGANNSDALSQTNVSRSLSGFSLGIKAQAPLTTDSMTFVPKAGIGYSYAQLTENTLAADLSTVTSSLITRMTGFYGMIGIDVTPYQDWLVTVDYAHSFTSDGSTQSSFNGALSQTESVVSGNFDRLRAGVFYRVAPHFIVGAEYTRRYYNFGLTNALGTSTLSTTPVLNTTVPTTTDNKVLILNQGLALFMYEL
jgi:hypothetical protein